MKLATARCCTKELARLLKARAPGGLNVWTIEDGSLLEIAQEILRRRGMPAKHAHDSSPDGSGVRRPLLTKVACELAAAAL